MLKYIVVLPFVLAIAYTLYEDQAAFMTAFIIVSILLFRGLKK